MSENIIIQKKVNESLNAAIRRKADSLRVEKAVYFNIAYDRRAPATVNPWAISPIGSTFPEWKEYREVMLEYLNSQIGRISTTIREDGIVKIDLAPADANKEFAISIYGQSIGKDVFLSGVLAKSGLGDRLDLILQEHDYSAVADYLALS